MKIREIRAKAKALRLKSTFGLSKAELIRRIQKAEGNFGRNVPRKPRFVGGAKGHNINVISFPGSPALPGPS